MVKNIPNNPIGATKTIKQVLNRPMICRPHFCWNGCFYRTIVGLLFAHLAVVGSLAHGLSWITNIVEVVRTFMKMRVSFPIELIDRHWLLVKFCLIESRCNFSSWCIIWAYYEIIIGIRGVLFFIFWLLISDNLHARWRLAFTMIAKLANKWLMQSAVRQNCIRSNFRNLETYAYSHWQTSI